jgi:hypothetical protein
VDSKTLPVNHETRDGLLTIAAAQKRQNMGKTLLANGADVLSLNFLCLRACCNA